MICYKSSSSSLKVEYLKKLLMQPLFYNLCNFKYMLKSFITNSDNDF